MGQMLRLNFLIYSSQQPSEVNAFIIPLSQMRKYSYSVHLASVQADDGHRLDTHSLPLTPDSGKTHLRLSKAMSPPAHQSPSLKPKKKN